MDASGKYAQEIYFDYPSDDQIVDIITKNEITPIFAITQNSEPYYRSIHNRLSPSALGILKSDSSNVVQLLIDEYNSIAKRAELIPQSDAEGVTPLTLQFYSNCNGDTEEETSVCEELASDREVTFTIVMNLADCLSLGQDLDETIDFHIKGLPMHYSVAIRHICDMKWD